jgi:hypothetical protein
MTDHHHTTGSPNSNGSGYDADKALADLFLYLDVCCGGESTSGWLHVSVGYNPQFDRNGTYCHTKANGAHGLLPRPFRWPDHALDAMEFILAESAKADVWVCPNLMRRDWIWTAASDTDRRIRRTGIFQGG